MQFRVEMKVAAMVLTCAGCGASEPMRPANVFEKSYKAIAVERRDPTLCYKIATDSYVAAGGNPRGVQVYYVRSQCFFELADRRLDPTLCDEVRTLSTAFLDGSRINAESCRAAATTPPTPTHGIVGGQEELFLRLFGYLGSNTGSSIEEVVTRYSDTVKTGKFGERAESLPDFSQGDEVAHAQIEALAPHCRSASSERLCELIECALIRNKGRYSDCSSRLRPLPFSAR